MSEVKIPLRTFRIEKKCEVEGCVGELETAGLQGSHTLAGLPSTYSHVCNVCGINVMLTQSYPKIVHEVDDGHQS